MILVSFQSVSKRLSLLALASTVPFNCPPSETLRHRKGNRDQIVFLKLYLLYRGSTRGFSFSVGAIAMSASTMIVALNAQLLRRLRIVH